MAGAPACPRCTIAMAVEPPGTLPQVSTPPIIEDVESAMAADMQNALADAQQANVVLPPHEQLALDPKAQARHDQMLEESYEQCRKITAHYAKTFYFGTKFFDEPKRKAVWAVYAWCRRTDDIVDKPRKDTTSLRDELADWTERLRLIFNEGIAYDAIDLALVDTIRNYPGLTIQPFEDMVKGMVMDLDQNRFDTFDELYVYCYRVAGTVGLMVLPIMGTAEDATLEEALEPALALGVALQLTNILRDVGEDRARQRIYLPREDLERFGVSELKLLKGVKDEAYVNMLKFQIARAREWYARAEAGIPMLAEDAQLPVRTSLANPDPDPDPNPDPDPDPETEPDPDPNPSQVRASLDMYAKILEKIEGNDYDNFNLRAYTPKWQKLLTVCSSWAKVQMQK
jgi:phytoene synthase